MLVSTSIYNVSQIQLSIYITRLINHMKYLNITENVMQECGVGAYVAAALTDSNIERNTFFFKY